jgi:hypothetical protein
MTSYRVSCVFTCPLSKREQTALDRLFPPERHVFESNGPSKRDPRVRFSIVTSGHSMFQTFSTIMWLPILECTTVATVSTLRVASVPFGKSFYEEKNSVERIRGVCVDVLAPVRWSQHPHVRSECVQGRCGPLRHRTEGRLVFYALWCMRFLRGLTNLFPILQAVTEITGVRHLTHELAPGCARAFGRVYVEGTAACSSFGLKATQTSPKDSQHYQISLRVLREFRRIVCRIPDSRRWGPALPIIPESATLDPITKSAT